MPETSATDKPKKNYAANELLDLFEKGNSPTQFSWFDTKFFNNQLSLASADSTIHIVRIYLKVFCLKQTIDGKGLFTRSMPYPMENRRKIAEVLRDSGYVLIGEHLDDHVFATNTGVVSLFDNGYLNSFSTDPEENERVFDAIDHLFKVPEEIVNRAYILRQTGGGYDFTAYKVKERALIEENYMPEVVEQLADLYTVVEHEEPFGRLAILEGPPGSGKTSLIRGMMNEFGKPKFVIVPPYLVAHLSSPAMISSLIQEQHNDPRPLVLVLEDADDCLTTRAGDNMSNISAVLNLADGALSDTLDIRMVATTNAKRVNIDDALERDGRVGVYIQVANLSQDRAVQVLMRLLEQKISEGEALAMLKKHAADKESKFKMDNIVLANVYAVAAKENGTYRHVKLPRQQRAIGF